MTGHGLQAASELRKSEAESLARELAGTRRELAARDAALAELVQKREVLTRRMVHARNQVAGARDVPGLRWADDHLRGLEREHAQLAQRVAALSVERVALAGKVATVERRFLDAEVARRALGTVIEKRELAEHRRRELAAEEALEELARTRSHAK